MLVCILMACSIIERNFAFHEWRATIVRRTDLNLKLGKTFLQCFISFTYITNTHTHTHTKKSTNIEPGC